MSFNFQFLYILFVGLAAVSVISAIGFLNYASAANVNMSENMNTTGNMNMSGNMNKTMNENVNMTGSMNGNMTENMKGNMTGHTNTTMQKILSPLQQFKSGISAKSVQCDQGFTLIIKIEDGSPACVTPQIAQVLTARGWGTMP